MTEWILSSSVLILAVILVRQIFRDRMRPLIRYALWGLVLVRLLVPISFFQSPVSTEGLLSGVQKLPPVQSVTDSLAKPNISFEDAYDQAVEDFQQAGQEIQQTIPDFTAPNYTPQTPLEQHTQEILNRSTTAFWLEQALLWVWIGGMAVMALCLLLSNLKFRRYLRIHRQLLEKHPAGLKVYVCPGLDTPCLFGAVKPAIYLLPTEAEDEAKKQHILTHELTHYCHGDHIWAALRCLCLVVHWFNPLVWAAANLSRRDAELACDEATIRKLGEDQRIAYGKTLIEMTCAKQAGAELMNTATTMTGSKAAIFERVTMIAKKPKKSIVALIAVLLIAVTAAVICFSTLGNIPTLSAEKRAQLEQTWHNYDLDLPFYDPKVNKEAVRYYGTYTDDNGREYDLLFVSYKLSQGGFRKEDYSNIPVDIIVDGKHFTHRSPFIIYRHYKAPYADWMSLTPSWKYLYADPDTELSSEDKRIIAQVHRIHNAYETRLYGSVLANTKLTEETDIQKQIYAQWQIRNADAMAGFVRNYGKLDGYYVILWAGGAQWVITKQIGGHAFSYSMDFGFQCYKDGVFYDLEKLYEEGKITDESIATLAEAHRIARELPNLTDKTRESIQNVWYAEWSRLPTWYSDETEDAKLGGIRYYGTYNGRSVVLKPLQVAADGIDQDGNRYHELSYDQAHFDLYALSATRIIPLQDAYNRGFITLSDLNAIDRVHKVFDEMIYGTGSDVVSIVEKVLAHSSEP